MGFSPGFPAAVGEEASAGFSTGFAAGVAGGASVGFSAGFPVEGVGGVESPVAGCALELPGPAGTGGRGSEGAAPELASGPP